MIRSLVVVGVGVLLLTAATFPQTTKEKTVKLTCNFQGCTLDSVFLYEFNGVGFRHLQSAPVKENVAEFSVKVPGPQFFYVGTGANNVKPLILGEEKVVVIKGDCKRMRMVQFPDPGLNQQYGSLTNKMNQDKAKMSQLIRKYRQAYNNEEMKAQVTAEMAELDKAKLQLLDSMKQVHPYLGKIASLNTYLSFQNHGGDYANEILYFVNTYFQYVDWNDKDYAHLPWVYEAMKAYTETLNTIGLTQENHKKFLEATLARIPKNTRTRQLALGGVMAGLQAKNHPNYVPFADMFVKEYGEQVPEAVTSIKTKLRQMQALVVGGEAPDFTQNNPEGEAVSLSDLRGNVVLVDFWASWCGPCRRENPNVVKLYNKYNEKGFEILGVSLDKQHDRWVKAIEADGLAWEQVSDLQGWKNAAAGLYGVRSIPHTILLDKEGKIIARNLRGAALEKKLEEVFGE